MSMKESKRQTETSRARKPEPSVNMDELRELIALLRENGLSEFELEREGFRVRLRRGADYSAAENTTLPAAPVARAVEPPPAAPIAPSPVHPGSLAGTPASEDQDLHIIESPIVGTFYRARSPNAEAFVKTGSQVNPDTIVCIIEAMKLMNEIQAETSGEVVKIYVENGQPVEYGQPLFGIKK
jgi:acetyl-CoA carboxylase biotin carboxyl carrier protein